MTTTQRPNMWQRIGGLAGGSGTPEELEMLGRQGLLHAGLGILANNRHNGRAGPAIGAGLQSGLLAAAQMEHQRRAQERELHDPAGLREHGALVEAATRNMGPEEAEQFRARAAGVRLGMYGRAPSSAAKTVTFEGMDGRTRTGIFDPMQRTIFGPNGEQFSVDQVRNVQEAMPPGLLGGALEASGPPQGPQSGLLVPGFGTEENPVPESGRQAALDQIAQIANTMAAAGIPLVQVDAWAQQQLGGGQMMHGLADAGSPPAGVGGATHAAPPAPNPDAFVSRRPEDEAAATEAARIRAQLNFAPEVAAADAHNRAAVTQAEGTTRSGVTYLDDLNDRANKAGTEEGRLQQLEYALSRTYSGFGAEQLLTLRQMGGALGIGDTEALGAGELARSISNQLALGLRNPAGGEGMPGNLSNADRDFLQRSVPSLQNSPEGWREMINMRRRLNQYALAQSQEANRYLEAGGSATSLRPHMQRWADANPLFAAPAAREGGRRTLQGESAGLADDVRGSPPVAGARRAPDGHWYVQRNGRWFIVEDE